jgi:hypothetical protein
VVNRRKLFLLLSAIAAVIVLFWSAVGDVPFISMPGAPVATAHAPTPSSVFPDEALLDSIDASVVASGTGMRPAELDVATILAEVRRRARPNSTLLWDTERDGYTQANAGRLWTSAREVSLAGFPAWQVPIDPTWNENPFTNSTWRLYYQSLGWLRVIDASSQDGRTSREPEGIEGRYLLDWIKDNPMDMDATSVNWGDHVVALRTDYMVGAASRGVTQAFSDDELSAFVRSLEQHGERLAAFLNDPQWKGHNHRMFHALALYNLTGAFPELAGAAEWHELARDRVEELLTDLVDPVEGVSLEQAPAYHFVDLDLILQADEYLMKWNDGFGQESVDLIRKMLDFAAIIVRPDGTLPPIGDTPYGSVAPLGYIRHAAQLGIRSPLSSYLISDGQEGEPPPGAAFFPRAGYAVFRMRQAQNAQPIQAVLDIGQSRRIHGHDDALSLDLWSAGHEVVTDSGGPYAYGTQGRFDLVINPAHSIASVSDVEYLPGDVDVGRLADNENFAVAEGSHDKFRGFHTTRTAIVLKKPGKLIVVDQIRPLTSSRATPRVFNAAFHLGPDAAPVELRIEGTRASSAFATGSISVAASSSVEAETVEGRTKPHLLGWVTPRVDKIVPAPVVTFSVKGVSAWFVTVIDAAPGAVPTNIVASRSPDGTFHIVLYGDEADYNIDVPTVGQVVVEESPPLS